MSGGRPSVKVSLFVPINSLHRGGHFPRGHRRYGTGIGWKSNAAGARPAEPDRNDPSVPAPTSRAKLLAARGQGINGCCSGAPPPRPVGYLFRRARARKTKKKKRKKQWMYLIPEYKSVSGERSEEAVDRHTWQIAVLCIAKHADGILTPCAFELDFNLRRSVYP